MPGSTLPFLSRFSPENIIIRMPNWLGDLVMATPILSDLRNHWPQAKITAMCQGGSGDILDHDPHLDELLKFNKINGWLHRTIHGDTLSSLIQGKYDLGILLTNSFSSAWWFWRGKVKNRIGYATHFRSWLLDYPVDFSSQKDSQHLVITYKELLAPLGIPISSTPPKLYLTEEEKEAAKSFIFSQKVEANDILIGINPGAAYGSAKCWLPERFIEVSRKLIQNPHIKLLYLGDKIGTPLVNMICQSLPPEQTINMAGKTNLRQLLSFIAMSDLFLTNDSGPMHIASAFNVPLVALFGSTNSTTTGPYTRGTVIHKKVACSPCYRRTCPIDFRCMKNIEVEEVYLALQNIIKTVK